MSLTRVAVIATMAGLVVLTIVLVLDSLQQTGVARIVGYQRFSDDHGIVVIVQIGASTQLAERQVEETDSTVKVTVHVRTPGGAVPAYLIEIPVPVNLQSALRDRVVVNETGTRVEYLGVYQRPSPVPRP